MILEFLFAGKHSLSEQNENRISSLKSVVYVNLINYLYLHYTTGGKKLSKKSLSLFRHGQYTVKCTT